MILFVIKLGGKMETKKVKIGDNEYEVKEMLAIDFDVVAESEGKIETMRLLHTKGSNISVEEYDKLTFKERNILTQAINEINGWGSLEEDEPSLKKKV